MKKFRSIFHVFVSRNAFVFTFLCILIFFSYRTLFTSYFESDEWFYFTYYLPLTRQPYGWITAITSNFSQSGYISGGQHVVPIASLIYYLNTKFFGLNFFPYAFMSLLLHTINSLLIFILIQTLQINTKRSELEKRSYGFLGSLFFALTPVPMHAFTGFAAFYGQNVLSVMFTLLCIIYFQKSFIEKKTQFIYFTAVFLFLSLFTQESSSFLFFVLPVMTVYNRSVFPRKFFGIVFIGCLTLYLVIRFIVPNIHSLPEQIASWFIPTSYKTAEMHKGISLYKNLPSELLFRSVTFPLRMLGSIYFPRETLFSMMKSLAPVIAPSPPGGDTSVQAAFYNYSGNSVFMFIAALSIIYYCFTAMKKFVRNKQYGEANFIATGLAIVTLGALPLIAIIFTFPTWGYDIYFDSRHYYKPGIGAAILFPFLIVSIASFIAKHTRMKNIMKIIVILLLTWGYVNIFAFTNSIRVNTRNYSVDRREVVRQITDYLPALQSKTIFYIETDGTSPFGTLPFFTSVPQALSVVYFYRNGLPASFYDKQLFGGEPQGYQYENSRGFGYYTSKQELMDAIASKKFAPDDVYGFYYYGKTATIEDISLRIREELKQNDDMMK